MKLVCPTITAENPHVYREQIERVQTFVNHVHLDLMDGVFTSNKSIDLEQLWMPDTMTCDVHLMYKNPDRAIDELEKLSIRTVIVPAEAETNFAHLKKRLADAGIQFGIALLAQTSVDDAQSAICLADHVLIFSGNLGHQGGSTAELKLLEKIPQILKLNPSVEIGWDGGVNLDNISQISGAGVSIINSGGFVQFAADPAAAYHSLKSRI